MRLLAVLLFASLGLLLTRARPADPGPEPSPSLTPEAVIRIQIEALQTNDQPHPDAGIETTFRFASPSNRAATGPLDRFAQMIRMGYGDLLGFERATYGRLAVDGDRAAQRVTLRHADGRETTYVFGLSRQMGGACDGCWMTDSVVRPQADAPRIETRRT